jgi:hypothetical protein
MTKENIETETEDLEYAVSKILDCEPCEVEKYKRENYGLPIYTNDDVNFDISIGDWEQVQKATEEAIKGELWSFNTSFILMHSRAEDSAQNRDVLSKMLESACENANEIIEALIIDIDTFIEDAIKENGRGEFLNSDDQTENEIRVNGKIYYYYMFTK